MPKILVPKTMPSRQIEFPDDVKRSKPGALYFSPGVMKDITKEEYEYLMKHHKKFAASLIVLSDKEKQPKEGVKKMAPIATGPKTVKSQAKLRAEARLLKGQKLPVEKTPGKTNEPAKSANVPNKATNVDGATGSDVPSQSSDTSNSSKKDGHQKGNK